MRIKDYLFNHREHGGLTRSSQSYTGNFSTKLREGLRQVARIRQLTERTTDENPTRPKEGHAMRKVVSCEL